MNTAEGPLSERCLRTVRWKRPAGSWKEGVNSPTENMSVRSVKAPGSTSASARVLEGKDWGLSTPSGVLPHLDVCSGPPKLEPKGHGD